MTRDERAPLAIAWVMGIAGVVARIHSFAGRGSLWQDEATLALNVLGSSFAALLSPLDWAQAAPPAYLWLAKATATALGGEAWTLRLVPLFSGIALLALVGALARRLAGAWAGALAVSVAAFSQLALRYTTEAKPYASDAAIAAALLGCAVALLARPREGRRWILLALAGVVALASSVPSLFVLAAIAAALAWDRGLRADSEGRRRLATTAALFAGVFALLYLGVYRTTAASPYLREFWSPVMLDPLAANAFFRLQWIALELTWFPFRMTHPIPGLVAAVVLWIAGLVLVARRGAAGAWLLGGPVLAALAASVLGRYPFSDRLAFFAVPGVWIAQAAAVAWLVERGTAAVRWRGIAACLLLAAATLEDASRFLRAPGALAPSTRLIETVRERAEREHAPVYVHARTSATWIHATTDWRDPDLDRLERYRAISAADDAPGFENLRRDRAVLPGEGDPLLLRRGDRVELIGLAAGMFRRKIGRPEPFGPSAGWAREEARRLRDAASPEVWLFAAHCFEDSRMGELTPLLEAARAAGLEVVETLREDGDAVALRLRRVE